MHRPNRGWDLIGRAKSSHDANRIKHDKFLVKMAEAMPGPGFETLTEPDCAKVDNGHWRRPLVRKSPDDGTETAFEVQQRCIVRDLKYKMIKAKVILSIYCFFGVGWSLATCHATEVDLELVLAVDASASISADEFRLQMDGIASAFNDHAIKRASQAGPNGRIAVSLVLWADATVPPQSLPWQLIEHDSDAAKFARQVANMPRRVVGGTGIGAGIAKAIRLIDSNPWTSPRRVVDVSGDGKETPAREELAPRLIHATAMARARGVTVNGLAILSDVSDLHHWYRDNVLVGPSSFVMTARNFEDFKTAIRLKLLREIMPRTSGRSLSTRQAWLEE